MSDARPSAGPGARAWQRGATATVLGGGYLLVRRHGAQPNGSSAGARTRAAAGALCAGGGPALLIARRLGGRQACWRPPASTAGRLLLGGYVAGGALVEEALWRAPLILICERTGSRPAVAARRVGWPAALSAAGFLALHVRRDGARSLPAHLTTTASWTVSALLGRQLRWPVLGHAGYNFAAASLRARGAQAS